MNSNNDYLQDYLQTETGDTQCGSDCGVDAVCSPGLYSDKQNKMLMCSQKIHLSNDCVEELVVLLMEKYNDLVCDFTKALWENFKNMAISVNPFRYDQMDRGLASLGYS